MKHETEIAKTDLDQRISVLEKQQREKEAGSDVVFWVFIISVCIFITVGWLTK